MESPVATVATALLQGRVGSTRLPGKVLLPLAGEPAIWRVYERLRHCRRLARIIVATSTHPRDDPIAALFADRGVTVFRGSEADPLDRYHQAAQAHGLEHVVRVMADCPLVDPELVDRVVERYFAEGLDVCGLGGAFPTGLDVTVFSARALAWCWQEAHRPSEREHITPCMLHHPERFRVGTLEPFQGLGHLRWVMDHPQDYTFIRAVYDALFQPGRLFTTAEILAYLEAHPELLRINGEIPRDQGYWQAVAQEQDNTP